MPEVDIHIGGRTFQVACQPGEEQFLQSAAALLDNEAQALADALGRLPEARMLLMAGLMLADKTAGLEEELREAERKLASAAAPAPRATPSAAPMRVEVPVMPKEAIELLSRMADRADGVASQVEDKLAG